MSNRLCLSLADWPIRDQQLWAEAQRPPGFLEAPKPASQWSPQRLKIVETSYGQWLFWLLRHGHLVPHLDPGERAIPELVLQYVADLRARVAPASVSMMVGALQRMLQVLAPHMKWDWLRRLYAHAKATAKPQRPRTAHAVPPEQLFELGLRLMNSPCPSPRASKFHHSTRYRDGLLIAVLISCPVRISNLEHIEIGKHLLFEEDHYWLSFPEGETKTREPFMGDLPASLAPWIDRYLKDHRPVLLARCKDAPTRRLWVDRHGTPMSQKAIRDQIKLRTRRAFGRHVWPHLFRHCAVTGLVDVAPEQIAIAPDLLGHASLQTTQKHYILARGTRAHQAVQKTLSDARQEARTRLGKSGP